VIRKELTNCLVLILLISSLLRPYFLKTKIKINYLALKIQQQADTKSRVVVRNGIRMMMMRFGSSKKNRIIP